MTSPGTPPPPPPPPPSGGRVHAAGSDHAPGADSPDPADDAVDPISPTGTGDTTGTRSGAGPVDPTGPAGPVDPVDITDLIGTTGPTSTTDEHDRRSLRELVSRMSLGARVGALVALAVGLGVALTALAGYLAVAGQLRDSADESLIARAQKAAESPVFANPTTILRVPAEAILATDIRIALVDATGSAHSADGASSAPPLGQEELDVARGVETLSLRTAELDGEAYRVVAIPSSRPGTALVIGQSTAQTESALRTLRWVSVAVGGAGIVLAGWAGASVARAGLRPVRRLTDAAEHVAATGQLDPIEVASDDEIGRLTSSFNAMLAAVSESQRRQAALVADAGHELRTPLTSMRTNLDLLAQNERQGGLDPEERAQIIADVHAQVAEMSTLIGDLIELSRDDSDRPSDDTFDLADVVRDAVSRVRLRASAVAFSVDLRPWQVHGDERMLGRAVTNLLDNAAKYSPPHGTVTVVLREGRVEVSDQGKGIADADLPHVFERFYRSTEARALPGSGLGLAIVKAAAERHGGTVVAGRAPDGGAVLAMTVPGSSSAPLT